MKIQIAIYHPTTTAQGHRQGYVLVLLQYNNNIRDRMIQEYQCIMSKVL